MAEELELLSKIKFQQQELEEIERNISKVEEENEILYEQKQRLDEQVEQKQKELQDKRAALENMGRGRVNKEDVNDIERREKELDELVREKLIDLMMSEEDRRKSTVEETLSTNMIISSVLVRYIPDVSDGDMDAMDKADPQEAFFRLNNHTTFRDIKETACEFWKIEEISQVGLRASNYSLLDLYLDQNVQEKILTLRIPPEFWLFKINKLAKTTFTDLKDCFIDSAIASQFKITAPRKRQENKSTGFRKSVHKRIIEKIKGVYRGLESYEKKPIDLRSDLIERNRIESPSYNFLASLLIMLMMLFTLLLLGFRRDVIEDFWIQSGLNNELISQNGSISFWDIEDLKDVDKYILDTLGPAMYADDNITLVIPRRYFPTGKLRIRQLRSRVKPCKNAEDYGLTLVCYENKYLDGKFTKNMTGGKDYNMYHGSTSAPKLLVGEIDTYDSSGFYADFPMDLNLSEFRRQYSSIADTKWLDQSTRAVIINANLYLPNTNQFVVIFILVEANVLGDSFPSKLQGQTVYSNLYTNSSTDKAMLAIEILRLCLSFFLLYLYIIEGLIKDSKGKRNVINWYNVKNLINLLLFVLIIVALAISFKVNKDPGDILGENYVDLLELAENYQMSMVMNCWVLLIACFRFTMTFKFINNVSMFHYALDLASKNIIYYMLILLPLLIGMFVLTSHMLGPFDFYYRKLKLVAVSNILFGIGYREIDYALRLSKAWSIGFILVYYYVIMFFLYAAFIGIIMDSYRISELRHQSVEEAQAKDSEYKPWKLWIFSSFNQCKRSRSDD